MGLFNKFIDVIKSNINDLLDKAEDPEKMIKLMIVEMQEAVIKATSSLAQAMANRNRLEKQYKAYEKKEQEWLAKAKSAKEAGKIDLAKKALKQKLLMEQNKEQYKKMFEQADATTAKLKEQVEPVKSKIR